MKKKFVSKRRSRKGSVSFNPNRQYIEQAVQAYLNDGGRIDHLEVDEKAFEQSLLIRDAGTEVDDFLNGE